MLDFSTITFDQGSLVELIETLTSCNPYFVRCIKPNARKAELQIDLELVRQQLRYSGMLETIRVRKAGFAGRIPFGEFLNRYTVLCPASRRVADEPTRCATILTHVNIQREEWQCGRTRIFLKSTAESQLEQLRTDRVTVCITKLQAFFRMCICKLKFRRMKQAVRKIEKLQSNGSLLKKFQRLKRRIIMVQSSISSVFEW